VLLLDDDETVSIGSRGLCYAKRTLEILDRLGCGDPVVQKGVGWSVGRTFLREAEVYHFDLLPEADHERPGMINLQLDPEGRLLYFQAIPPEKEESPQSSRPADWLPLFTAAGLDQASFHSVDSVWDSLASADTRAAWDGACRRRMRGESVSLPDAQNFPAVKDTSDAACRRVPGHLQWPQAVQGHYGAVAAEWGTRADTPIEARSSVSN